MWPTSYGMGYHGETRYINSVEVHAQLSHKRHQPADGVLVVQVHSGPLSLWVLSLVVHGSHAYTLRIDWNRWCHVMKFEISLGSHHYAMVGIFDVMLWSLRYHLGRTLLPHTGDHFVNLLAGLSRGELTLIISSTFTTHGDCPPL
jgi:hypothetical protein